MKQIGCAFQAAAPLGRSFDPFFPCEEIGTVNFWSLPGYARTDSSPGPHPMAAILYPS